VGKASSGSRWSQIGLALVAGATLAACSGGQPAATGSRSVGRNLQAKSSIRRVASCLTNTTPANWRALLSAPALPPQSGFDLGPLAVSGHFAFGQVFSSSSSQLAMGEGNLLTGQISDIAPLPPNAAGLGAVAADLPWVVWQEGDSQGNPGDWSVHSWNQQTGVTKVLASSPGVSGFGSPPTPAVWNGWASWSQPTTTGSYQLLLVNLTTGKTRTLASGKVGAPVIAGPYLIWAEENSAKQTVFSAIYTRNLKPAKLPPALQGAQSVGSLAGSSQYLVWGTHNLAKLMLWRVGATYREEFAPTAPKGSTPTSSPEFQFPQLAGRYLLWYTGVATLTMDLQTGKGFVEKGDTGVATGSSEWLVAIAGPPSSGAKSTAFVQTRMLPLHTAAAPAIDSCD